MRYKLEGPFVRIAFYVMLVVSALSSLASAQSGGTLLCDPQVDQPILLGIDPPSGTKALLYAVSGQRLGEVASLSLVQEEGDLSVTTESSNSTVITFSIDSTPFDGPATLTLVPDKLDCESPFLVIELRRRNVGPMLLDSEAQSGTVIQSGDSCLPSDCGDNSTSYSIIVNGSVLELVGREITGYIPELNFAARFPKVTVAVDNAPIQFETLYSTFTTTAAINLRLPGSISSIQPPSGQRGTRVTIMGVNLLGIGRGVQLSRVFLGGNEAEILNDPAPSQVQIVVKATSGILGDSSIQINSTQQLTFNTGVMTLDGPYTSSDGQWTQLEDGVVESIIPPAAQGGEEVLLCGQRLTGGGETIISVSLAGQISSDFNVTAFESFREGLPNDECIRVIPPIVTVPVGGLRGNVVLITNTEAVVESTVEFSYATIQSITPFDGQFGTRVTISGIELLSGYSPSSVTPEVYLVGVKATVVSFNSSVVVVQANMAPTPQLSSGGVETGNIFGIMGTVEIVVSSPSLTFLSFNVTMDMGWTYLIPGDVMSVDPVEGQYGTLITLRGTNLLGYGQFITHATFDGVNGTVMSSSDNTVVLRAPDLETVGSVSIVLFADTGAQVTGAEFQYLVRGEITSVTPDRGQSGTLVTIEGTALFGYGNNIVSATFGGVAAQIVFNAPTHLDSNVQVQIQPNNNTADTEVVIELIGNTMAIVRSVSPVVWTYLVQGEVANVQPPEGQRGTLVTITGSNLLGGGSSVRLIFLDGVPGQTQSSSDTAITVIMDDIAQRTDVEPGSVYIQADTGALVFGGAYTHRVSGNITGFTPTTGREGTRIAISGNRLLGYGESIVAVSVAGLPSSLEDNMVSDDEVVVRVGPGAENATGPVILTVNTGASVSSVGMNFTYGRPGRITSVSPSSGAEGTGAVIFGVALDSLAIVVSITFGGSPVSRIITSSETQVSVIVGPAPTSNASSAEIVITSSDGSFVTGASFSFVDLPLSLVGLDRGQEGTRITIFLPPSFTASSSLRASIDDQEADILSVDEQAQSIVVAVPRARRPGSYTVDIAVENPMNVIARLRDGFTYLPEGVIYSVSPDVGQRGTVVMLTGDNLLGGGTTIAMATINIGANEIPAQVVNPTDTTVELVITENLPEMVVATYPIAGDIILMADTFAIVRRLGGFSLAEPGRITNVSPLSGLNGTEVTITGTRLLQQSSDLSAIASVTLAGVAADVLNGFTDERISVLAAPSLAMSGPIQLTLTTGAFITSDAFSYSYSEPATITAVSPSQGTVGTVVQISGTNLLLGASSIQIRLGGVLATINSSSMTNEVVVVTAQEGVAGDLGDVTIEGDTGAYVEAGDAWTYEGLGAITAVSPVFGQQGVQVIISGRSLLGSAASIDTCSLAGVRGSVSSSADDSVVCIAGDPNTRSEMTGPIRITASSGFGIVTNPANVSFTYYPAFIDEVTPVNGSNGTFVDIVGSNLFSAPERNDTVVKVLFGITPASVVESSRDQLRVRVGNSASESMEDAVWVTSSSGALVRLDRAWSYTQPGEIIHVTPLIAAPGETVTVIGINLVPPCMSDVEVIVGQSVSYRAEVLNTSVVEFRPGVYQNLDNPNMPLPIQIVSVNGATVYSDAVPFEYSQTGVVTAIVPSAGSVGTVVSITGTDLIGGGSILRVSLAGFQATVLNSSDTELRVRVTPGPVGGVTGSVVIEADNGRLTGIGGGAWTYLPVLTSVAVTPTTGQNGTVVSIDLSSVPTAFVVESVCLSGVLARDASLNSDRVLTVTAGTSEETNLGSVEIQFEDNILLVIPDSWTYRQAILVATVSPDIGYFRTQVSINGSNFQVSGATVRDVLLAGLQTEIISQNDNQIDVVISQLIDSSAGNVSGGLLIIYADGSAFFNNSLSFTFIQHSINSVTPKTGSSGTLVMVEGMGLLVGGDSIDSFSLGSVAALVVAITDSAIIVSAGSSPSASNISDVSYTVDTGAVVRIPDSWSYITPGAITGVSPSRGRRGTLVTITGDRMFGGGTEATEVFIGDIMASEIIIGTESLIVVRVGESSTALSPAAVVVQSDTGATTSSDAGTVSFQYQDPGIVNTVNPGSGQVGTMVTLTGTNLQTSEDKVMSVTIAGIEATIESITGVLTTTITARAGRPSMLGEFNGSIVIETESGAIAESSTVFFYLSEGQILSVTPERGQHQTSVRIRGDRLRGGGSRVHNVTLAGVEATIVSETDSEVLVTAAALNANRELTGSVVLTADSGASVQRLQGWTYVEPGVITSIFPTVGQYGTRVTITGERLLSGGSAVSQVLIGGVAATEIASGGNNETSITARIGLPAMGTTFATNNITVVASEGGRLESLSVSFQYLDQSVITNISPPSGVGNTTVTITGTNLLGGGSNITRITAAEIPARNIQQGDANSVIVFTTGLNLGGEGLMGSIEIESDTGAQTSRSSAWMYERECPERQFGTVNNCSNCSVQCSQCFGPEATDCVACRDFSIPKSAGMMLCVSQCPNVSTVENVCVDTCASNQYAQTNTSVDATFCLDCDELCDPNLRCSGPNASECGGCRFVYDNQSGFCAEACPPGTFNEGGVCRLCDQQCEIAAGCVGPTSSDCTQCRNFTISNFFMNTTAMFDFCISSCPSLYYTEVSTNTCRPCSSECLDSCTGSTAFNCNNCSGFTLRYDNGTTKCVATCNPDPSQQMMYDDMDGVCQSCSPVCSITGGCFGPAPSECNGCRNYTDTGVPFPTLDGACVAACPTAYYNNIDINRCNSCNADSCPNGPCSGPQPEDCLGGGGIGEAFGAGVGTIAVVVIISFLLFVILIAVIVLLVVIRCRSGSYKVTETTLELGEQTQRYAAVPKNKTEAQFPNGAKKEEKKEIEETPAGAYNATFQDGDVYADMGPEGGEKIELTELYTDMANGPQGAELAKTSVSASQELYTDMESAPLEDLKVATAPPPNLPPKPTEATTQPPVLLPEPSKKPSPPEPGRPPRPPPPPEDMLAASVQEVYMNPAMEESEEYSEMVATLATQDEVYDDAESILTPGSLPTSPSRTALSSEKTPLLSPEASVAEPIVDAVYEDTETAIAAVDQYRKTSAPTVAFANKPPELPSRPVPNLRKRLSSPLPLTPLDHALKSKSLPPGQSLSPPPLANLPLTEEELDGLYSETVPEEEMLYEAIPGAGASERLLPDSPTDSTARQLPPPSEGKSKHLPLPLPPKGKR